MMTRIGIPCGALLLQGLVQRRDVAGVSGVLACHGSGVRRWSLRCLLTIQAHCEAQNGVSYRSRWRSSSTSLADATPTSKTGAVGYVDPV
jgi:hypothetical protein